MKTFEFYPKKEKKLLTSTSSDVIKKIGEEAVREAILAVLGGENLRNLTEFITRRRLVMSNGALLIMFLRGCAKFPGFLKGVPKESVKKLGGRLNKNDKWILEWILGLTDKAVQNILRDDPKQLKIYKDGFEKTLTETVKDFGSEYRNLEGTFLFEGKKISVDWNLMMRVFVAIGSQTLAIRGSEKSTYGKLFEKLVLGSLLEILGFKLVDSNNLPADLRKVFWLSKTEKRESDATLIYKPGKGIRFDIGFIGRGNPEISLDKVSRFEREMTLGKNSHYMGTYIVVDRVGERSKIETLANKIGGDIIQMSLAYWPKTVAKLLKRDLGFNHAILGMNQNQAASFLKKSIKKIDFSKFVNS